MAVSQANRCKNCCYRSPGSFTRNVKPEMIFEPAGSLASYNCVGNERSIARPGKSYWGGSRSGVTLLRTLEQSIYRNAIGVVTFKTNCGGV